MDRKTLLAIGLSIFVLFTYETIFVAPSRAKALKNSQVNVNKQVKNELAVVSTIAPEEYLKPTSSVKEGQILSLETKISLLKFTSVGGSLHKLDFPASKRELPLADVLNIGGFETVEFSVQPTRDGILAFSYTDKNWQINKTISSKDAHLTKVRLEIKNVSEISSLENFPITAIGIDTTRLENTNKRETMLDEYSVGIDKKVFRKGNAFKFSIKENKVEQGNVKWVAFRDHYTAFIVKPDFETKGYEVKHFAENKLSIYITAPDKRLEPGESAIFDFTLYAGPQDIALLKSYGIGIDKVVAFSNFVPIDWFAHAIYFTVLFLQKIVKSWGLAIILISMIIYGLTYPLTAKSMMSMRKMQLVQPKIAALKDRYKNDPQKLNAEMVDIYRREKINPLGGCLPFLLQMPIFIALYQVLWRSFYFEGKSFLWIKDLAQADKLFTLPFTLPFLGNEFNILPILMAIVMFFQQKISAKNVVIMDETQAMQQKMMTFFFPVFIGFIFYKFASSLSLYFTMFYLFSTITQWKMNQTPAKV